MPTTVILPFDSKGQAVNVLQSPGGAFSHKNELYNSWDFSLGKGAEVRAVAKGIVVDFREVIPDGDSYEMGSDPSVGSGGIGNFVTLKHEINGSVFYTSYFHLQQNSVPFATQTNNKPVVGQVIQQGEVIGIVGNTGHRDGTHLHFQVGTSLISYGATKFGATDIDSGSQSIANASNTNANLGIINFKGYESSGYNLPSSVKSTVGTVDPIYQVSVSDSYAMEGDKLTFTVSLANNQKATSDIVVKYFTGPGTGVNGASSSAGDYLGIEAGSVTIKAGKSSATFTVTTKEDLTYEGDENFFVNLSSTSQGGLLDKQGVGTIYNDDAPPPAAPKASISDATVTEGGNLVFTVSLDKAATATTNVYFETVAGSAASNDFAGKSGYVTIAKGATTASLVVGTVDDKQVESAETMSVVLKSATNNVGLADSTGIGNIRDNDVAPVTPPKFTIGDASATEGNKIYFTVNLDKPADRAISLTYSTYKGTGETGANFNGDTDYSGKVSQTITIVKGASSAVIEISTIQDQKVERDETFSVNIENVSYGSIFDAWATGTIRNDDIAATSLPDLMVKNVSMNDITVNKGQSVRVNFDVENLTNGTAVSSDTLIFISRDRVMDSGDLGLKNVSLSSMAAFETDAESTSFIVPSNLGTGRFYLGVYADGGSVIREASETNNGAWTAFDIF